MRSSGAFYSQSLVVSTSRTDDDIEVLTILRVDISKAFPKRSVEAEDDGEHIAVGRSAEPVGELKRNGIHGGVAFCSHFRA
ncbi:hypothetical protein L596_005566 [Steinernema carpocapsae]|uniref:Uncharacterized protein n=1 Tax=Steinernema carpocapsae TaxID=34508 RepID=A0A4U8V0U9_STECR|nr:hypothetical protein L596_005566 [Steinernema carpocapsae]